MLRFRLALALSFMVSSFSVLAGCGRSYGKQACRMENEVVLAESKGIPTSVAVVADGNQGFQVAWATDNATWVSDLDSSGSQLGKPRKIIRQNTSSALIMPLAGEAKTFWPREDRDSIKAEHLVLLSLADEQRLVVAVERPEITRRGGIFAALFRSSLVEDPEIIQLGSAGEYSGRVAAAALGEDVIVAWHDGRLDASNVHIARLSLNPLSVKKTSMLESKNPVFSPSLAVVGETFYLAWSEIVEENTIQRSSVHVAEVGRDLETRNPAMVHKGLFVDNEPEMALATDQLGIVFRDDADEDGTLEYHFALLDNSGNPLAPPKRISQADGWRGPRLAFLDSRFIATTIRSFQRNLLIGLNQFDIDGEKLGGEFQVYADKTDFVRVDLTADQDQIIMIYAEDRRDSGRILSARITCHE